LSEFSVCLEKTGTSAVSSLPFIVYGIYSLHPRKIDEDVDIESVCSDMSDAMSQISIDTESKLSPSDFQKLFPGFKGSKMHKTNIECRWWHYVNINGHQP
jgi:hypothetical protein